MDIEDELDLNNRDDLENSDDEDQNDDVIENQDARSGDEDAENGGQPDDNTEEQNETSQKKPVKKRIILNPRPKLDPQRLGGAKGIPILPKLFENRKFKGKGFEKEDLNQVMSVLEHWGHRLFPIMTFDTLLAAIEKLGTKKSVQVCVKKMRMDMPILDDDFVTQRDEDENMDPSANSGNNENHDSIRREDDFDMNDAFDQLVRNENTHETNHRNDDQLDSGNTAFKPPEAAVITDEMRSRMERNKQLALERKRMRQLEREKFNTAAEAMDADGSNQVSHNDALGMDDTTNNNNQTGGSEVSRSSEMQSSSPNGANVTCSQKDTNGVNLPNSESVENNGLCVDPDNESRRVQLLNEDELLQEMWGEER